VEYRTCRPEAFNTHEVPGRTKSNRHSRASGSAVGPPKNAAETTNAEIEPERPETSPRRFARCDLSGLSVRVRTESAKTALRSAATNIVGSGPKGLTVAFRIHPRTNRRGETLSGIKVISSTLE
jgi:hypothetical protein